ncbi:hypothetical protein GX51_07518 [Blastomyces parvus]|uniref:Uncharacterized protein n=1 Tax=Blastomyces parvus TaxID=2060905 RepID=A0A2B7WKE1_9EURO|nr:hypothetical protein GX51_07518 [Blastomyces parvus]
MNLVQVCITDAFDSNHTSSVFKNYILLHCTHSTEKEYHILQSFKLSLKFVSSFQIIQQIDDLAYKLNLLTK